MAEYIGALSPPLLSEAMLQVGCVNSDVAERFDRSCVRQNRSVKLK